MVHGDDFVTVGTRESATAFRKKLESRFEIKTQVIGSSGSLSDLTGESGKGPSEVREGRVLNRIIRWTEDGWEIEPDQRHADIIIHELQLQDARPVSSPGETEAKWEEEENAVLLSSEEASRFRALAARANYLAADRTNIMYAVKEICRSMASPTVGS